MCTYNISISDTLMQKALNTFSSSESMHKWIQQNIELLLINHLEKARISDTPINTHSKTHALSELRGILSSDKNPNTVREEHIEEKYGI